MKQATSGGAPIPASQDEQMTSLNGPRRRSCGGDWTDARLPKTPGSRGVVVTLHRIDAGEGSADDQLLDLAGALVESEHSGVTQVLAHRILVVLCSQHSGAERLTT